MFFSKPKSFLGVDIGAGGIKVVELHKEKNRPVLFTYGFTAGRQDVHDLVQSISVNKTSSDLNLTTGNEKKKTVDVSLLMDSKKINEYASVLKEVCKKARTVSKTAVVSLPVSSVFHAIVNLPPVKKNEFEPILKAEIKKLLPRPIEEMTLDYQVIAPLSNEKSQKVLINAVPREIVTFYTQIFQKAGLQLDSLEPESVALERALIGRDQSVAMVIDIGAERTNFFIIDQSYAITHNSIEVGGERVDKILMTTMGVEEKEVERLKFDWFEYLSRVNGDGVEKNKFLETFRSVIDPIVKEIDYSFELYLRQSGNEGKRPEKIILTGGGAFIPFLPEQISNQFKLKCYIGDPWGRVVFQDSLKPWLHKIGPRMAVAVGLALRNVV
ncbi:MAG: type IV pilus assembly protein PilM [bacterium]|nr:type IV pilus assembly protein PilM [bacterium]